MMGTAFVSMLFLISVVAQEIAESPLPPCPPSDNCIHAAYHYTLTPSVLADHVEHSLRALSPESLESGFTDMHVLHAVYKVWFFRDDVHIAIIKNGEKSTLFIRSASRTGYSDLGVNRRRVDRIIKKLERLIAG